MMDKKIYSYLGCGLIVLAIFFAVMQFADNLNTRGEVSLILNLGLIIGMLLLANFFFNKGEV